MKKTIGVIGLGSIGMRHAMNFIELGQRVIGYDPDQSKINELRQHGGLSWDGIPRELDGVVIASPTNCHHDDIGRMVGVPTFVEKPIINTRTPINISNVLMVGYMCRFHSCVKKAREWLGKGVIGKPVWARFTCAQYNDKSAYLRDGVILNWSHEIDLALYLLGTGHLTAASVDYYESVADLSIYNGGVSCCTTIHLDYLTKYERRSFLIVGDRGSIEADLVGRQALHLDNSGVAIERFGGRDSFDGNYLDEARCFLKRLDGEETLGCTAAEAMKVVELCLQAKEYVRGR